MRHLQHGKELWITVYAHLCALLAFSTCIQVYLAFGALTPITKHLAEQVVSADAVVTDFSTGRPARSTRTVVRSENGAQIGRIQIDSHGHAENFVSEVPEESDDSQDTDDEKSWNRSSTASTTTLAPPHCEVFSDYRLCRIAKNQECRSTDLNLSTQVTLEECAEKVKYNGGRFLSYGYGEKLQQCWQELPGTDVEVCYTYQDQASCCPQFYEADLFDFWIIVPTSPWFPVEKRLVEKEPVIDNPAESGAHSADTIVVGLFIFSLVQIAVKNAS